MATKKNTSSTKLMKKKADDAVVYQVMAALVLLCCGLLGLRSLRAYYSTIGGFSALYDVSYLIGIGGTVLALACIVAAILVKRPLVRALLPWPAAVGILTAATGFSMRLAWTDGFPFLYFFCGALALQYIILKLYRWEFFLVSLSTVLAGGLYFCLSSGMLWTYRAIFLIAVLAVTVVGSSLAVLTASRHGGYFRFFRWNVHLLGKNGSPVLVLAANGLWFLCTVAVLILGSLFAYYCMFAAIAVEFVAAVYYTFQLN